MITSYSGTRLPIFTLDCQCDTALLVNSKIIFLRRSYRLFNSPCHALNTYNIATMELFKLKNFKK